MDPAIAITGLFRFDLEDILADPVRLGIFLELAQTIIELEPRAREAAITLTLGARRFRGGVWSGARAIDLLKALTSMNCTYIVRLVDCRRFWR